MPTVITQILRNAMGHFVLRLVERERGSSRTRRMATVVALERGIWRLGGPKKCNWLGNAGGGNNSNSALLTLFRLKCE